MDDNDVVKINESNNDELRKSISKLYKNNKEINDNKNINANVYDVYKKYKNLYKDIDNDVDESSNLTLLKTKNNLYVINKNKNKNNEEENDIINMAKDLIVSDNENVKINNKN